MKRAKRTDSLKLAIAAVVTTFMLSACAAIPAPEGSAAARKKLTRLQANQELASRAPVAIKEAEVRFVPQRFRNKTKRWGAILFT